MRRRLALLGLFAVSCQTQEPTAPAPTPSAAPTATVALAATPAASASSGWSPLPAPQASVRPRPGPITTLAACVAEMRTGAWAGDDDAAPLYESALLSERASDLNSARRAYLDVIQRFPASRLVPLAYLGFGEMFAGETASDPSKWELARQSFLKVTEYPPTQNPIHGYASLRAADAERATGEDARALRRYQDAARGGREQQCETFIRAQAIEGAVQSYGKSGQPARAHLFFQQMLPGRDEEARAAVRLLAERYQAAGDRAGACQAITPVDGATSPLCRP